MSTKINDINDLTNILYARWSQLDDVDERYLSEAGVAAKTLYRAVIWQLAFHKDLTSLRESEEFINLSSVPNQHAEYYRILRMINRAIEKVE